MEYCEMTIEHLLKEYLVLASQAFQAKADYLKDYILCSESHGENKKARNSYGRNVKKYDKVSSMLNHINGILLSKGVGAEFLDKVKF